MNHVWSRPPTHTHDKRGLAVLGSVRELLSHETNGWLGSSEASPQGATVWGLASLDPSHPNRQVILGRVRNTPVIDRPVLTRPLHVKTVQVGVVT